MHHVELRHKLTRIQKVTHTLDLLIVGHGQVNRHGAGDNRLINLRRCKVRDEHHATFELKGRRQLFITHISTPRDNTARIRIKSAFKKVKRGGIFENRITVIKYNHAFAVLIKGAVQTFRRRVTFDNTERFLAVKSRTNSEIVDQRNIGHANVSQCLGDGEGLAKTTRTSDNNGRLVATGEHHHHVRHETETLVDGEPRLDHRRVDGLGNDRCTTRCDTVLGHTETCFGDATGHVKTPCVTESIREL